VSKILRFGSGSGSENSISEARSPEGFSTDIVAIVFKEAGKIRGLEDLFYDG
jgi:hypothetical protein